MAPIKIVVNWSKPPPAELADVPDDNIDEGDGVDIASTGDKDIIEPTIELDTGDGAATVVVVEEVVVGGAATQQPRPTPTMRHVEIDELVSKASRSGNTHKSARTHVPALLPSSVRQA